MDLAVVIAITSGVIVLAYIIANRGRSSINKLENSTYQRPRETGPKVSAIVGPNGEPGTFKITNVNSLLTSGQLKLTNHKLNKYTRSEMDGFQPVNEQVYRPEELSYPNEASLGEDWSPLTNKEVADYNRTNMEHIMRWMKKTGQAHK